MNKDKVSLWLEAHPFIDRLADAIIGAIIGAVLPKIYNIITSAKNIGEALTNYEFWLMICIFIISIVGLYLFVTFQTSSHDLEEEKKNAKIKLVNKLTNEILGESDFNKTLERSSELTTFIDEL